MEHEIEGSSLPDPDLLTSWLSTVNNWADPNDPKQTQMPFFLPATTTATPTPSLLSQHPSLCRGSSPARKKKTAVLKWQDG